MDDDEDASSPSGKTGKPAAFWHWVDNNTLSFGGSADLRVKMDETCSALEVKPTEVCLCMLASTKKVTPQDYLDLCTDPEAHGDFNSEVHKRSRKLRVDFRTKNLIDFSHDKRDPKLKSPPSKGTKRKADF